MSLYKIKIDCTSINNLSFDNKKINKKQYFKIHNLLNPNIFEYIDSIIILHKKFKNITIKTLEFLCNRELDLVEFLYY